MPVRTSPRRGFNRRGPTQQELFDSGQKLAHYRLVRTQGELLDLMGSEKFNAWVEAVIDPLPDNVSYEYVRKLTEQEIQSWECDCTPISDACPACLTARPADELVY